MDTQLGSKISYEIDRQRSINSARRYSKPLSDAERELTNVAEAMADTNFSLAQCPEHAVDYAPRLADLAVRMDRALLAFFLERQQ